MSGDGGVDRVRDPLCFVKTVTLENRPAIEDRAQRERWADKGIAFNDIPAG